MYKQASRLKVSFNHKGMCAVEDLWDLSLAALDKIYKDLTTQLQSKQGDSLLKKVNKEDTLINLKIAIVKDVFETLNAEKDANENKLLKKEKKQKLLKIIEDKQDADLQNKSVEELTSLVNEL